MNYGLPWKYWARGKSFQGQPGTVFVVKIIKEIPPPICFFVMMLKAIVKAWDLYPVAFPKVHTFFLILFHTITTIIGNHFQGKYPLPFAPQLSQHTHTAAPRTSHLRDSPRNACRTKEMKSFVINEVCHPNLPQLPQTQGQTTKKKETSDGKGEEVGRRGRVNSPARVAYWKSQSVGKKQKSAIHKTI